MKRNLYLLLSICFISTLSAQKIITGTDANQLITGATTIRYIDRSVYPSSISFIPNRRYTADMEVWLKAVLKLPKDYGLKLTKEEKDMIGYTHQDYQQYYKNIPVEYGIYKAHYNKDNILQCINGELYHVEQLNITPALSTAEAVVIAKDYTHAEKYKWEEGWRNSLSYYPKAELTILVNKQVTYLAYKVDVYAIQPLSRRLLYIDAHTGNIITEVNKLHDVNTPATAITSYSGNRSIMTWNTGSQYILEETTRGLGLQTVDYATSFPYSNATTTWNLVGMDQYALDAHWGAEMTYDYYFNTYGRNGLDGAGFFLMSVVNEGPGFGNAYWDGSAVHYGDGDGSTFTSPLTSLGIVGHEITHGLTEFTAGLVYSGESGALNESFSDIFGLSIDEYARGVNLGLPATWLVGAECTGGVGIRDLSNPNMFSCADTYNGLYWNNGDGVHYDSGVQNFWFYLLTMGGTGTNDIGGNYNVTGIGIDDAAAIAYRNLVYYLTPNSDFADSRYFSILAATDLFGDCSPQVASTTNAWHAVGVGGSYLNVTVSGFSFSNLSNCALPTPITFTNLSLNASSYLWDFGDGDTSTATNPTHLYNATGVYNVQLIATGCGTNVSDTFVANVVITTSSSIINLNPTVPQAAYCCNGTLYDSGGPGGDYADFENSTALITVPAGNIASLSFISFDVENGYDYVYLYDGPDASYPLIGVYTGSTLPNSGNPIYSTSNEMYLEFYSDDIFEGSGFQLNWQCAPSGALPFSLFTTNQDVICAGDSVTYINSSTNSTSIYWDFPGGSPPNSINNNVVVTYNTPGVYTTTLTAYNGFGSNTSTTSITVLAEPTPAISFAGNTVSVSPAFTSYQWYHNGVLIPGATAQSYIITQGGDYYCMVFDGNCFGNSATITNTLGVNTPGDANITIYPNPATVSLLINNSIFTDGTYEISLYNMLGEMILSITENSQQAMLDVANLSAGTYMIKISQDNWEVIKKIIIVK